MHICDHHIKVYYNIEKRKLVKIEIGIYRGTEIHRGTKIYRGGQKFIGGGQKFIGGTEMDQYPPSYATG